MSQQRQQSNFEQRNSGWEPCPAGELSRLAALWQTERVASGRVSRVYPLLALVAGLMLMVGLVWNWKSAVIPAQLELACAEVIEVDQKFVRQQLTPEMQLRVEQHLEHCSACREHMQILRNSLSLQVSEFRQKTAWKTTLLLGRLSF